MANQRDIDRWKKGKDHWNKWAEGRLKAKEKLEKEGIWLTDKNGNPANTQTGRWMALASVNFAGYTFPDLTEFSDFKFPYHARFDESNFRGNALFLRALFMGYARFEAAKFADIAWFDDANFEHVAWFDRVTFGGPTWFQRAKFASVAVFDESIFRGFANFGQVQFARMASFTAVVVEGAFMLEGVRFGEVPSFVQASFSEAPRLDDLSVPPTRSFKVRGNKELAARYRSLKRIALQAHDQTREHEFFASEARERRGNDDPIGSPNWHFSFIYELLSDFGRSIARPVGWLAVSLLVFAAIVGTNINAATRLTCNWQSNWLLPEIYLSFLHSLPIVGFGRGEKRDQALTCLFGDKANVGPGWDMLFISQNIWSAVLIFLFLLALRNHFRIK